MITGTDFTGATAVSVGGTACASFTVDSATQITCVLPAGAAGSADLRVTTPSGPGPLPAAFTYVAAPVDGSAPQLSGTATQGQTLTASPGSWSDSNASIAYQWQVCDSSGNSCVNIDGATSSTYTLAAGDVGHTIAVVVTATNIGGSSSSTSTPSSVVQAPPTPTPTPTPAPKPPGPTSVSIGAEPPAGIVVNDQGEAMLTLLCPRTPGGCDASGVLTIHPPNTLTAGEEPRAQAGTGLPIAHEDDPVPRRHTSGNALYVHPVV